MTRSPIEALADLAKSPGRALVCAHEKPDGDALGSLSGLLRVLRDNGIEADGVLYDGIPFMYESFLPEGILKSVEPADLKRYSRLFILDVSSTKRLSCGPALPYEKIDIPIVCLDHHPDNNLPCPAKAVDPKASSTCEMVVRLVEATGWLLKPEAATCLLLGIVSDTGCFKFDNTSPTALRAAAKLREAGADFRRIIRELYLNKPLGLAKLEAELLCEHLGLAFDGKLAYFTLEPELLRKHGVDLRDTENVIDVLRSLKGVEFAAILRPVDGGWKMSLRSKTPPYSAGRIARRLEGGGHEMAAGGLIRASTLDEAVRILKENVERELNEAPSRQTPSSPL